MIRNVKLLCAAIAGAFMAALPAQAADNYLFGFSPYGVQTLILNGTTVVQAVDTGWLRNTGFHDSSNNNYIAGDCATCGGYSYNDYFNFDLSGVLTPVTSAVLSVGNGNGYAAGPLSTFSLFDVNSPISSLDVNRGDGDAGGLALFNDLQSGTLYGSRGITNVVQNSQVNTTLNGAAISAINSALGRSFAIGGTLRPGTTIPGVPEPASWAMFICGFAVIGGALRRRTRALLAG